MFINAIQGLSEQKKHIIRELGFGSLLDFSCNSNINDIFEWLANHLETNSTTITFDNGFSFSLSRDVVYKILGIPRGNKATQNIATKEASDIIHKIVQMEEPTVEYLCSILTNELDETSFKQVFMVTTLNAFLVQAVME
jgi:hypothetical protein